MKKLAIVSIVLLLAGIGLAFGEAGHCAGNCNCPSGTACSQSVCGASCGGSCTQDASVTSSCGTHCPVGRCGGAGGCQACCGANCAACSGTAANQ